MARTNEARRVRRPIALLAALGLLLAPVQPAEAAFPGENGRIAFSSDRTDGRGVNNPTGDAEIFTVRPDGTGLRQLTFNRADDYGPDYGPDGDRITFTSDRDGASDDVDDVFVMKEDGSDQENLTRSPEADDSFSVWSPKGKEIAFTSDRDGNFEIYRMKDDGRGQRNLTRNPADDSGPAWSPDGKQIAFQSDRDGATGGGFATFDIFEIKRSGARPMNLTQTPGTNEVLPEWSPDGAWISFAGDNDGFFVLDIFKMRDDGSDRQNLTETPFAVEFFSAWSPDGKYISFDSTRDDPFISEEDVNEDIFTMKSDGSDETRISGIPGTDDYGPSWQPLDDDHKDKKSKG